MTFSVAWWGADGNEVVSFPATGYVALAARKVGVPVSEMQAVTWTAYRNRREAS